jgi:pimeloyl-ACP methyl ester carboxylesterase
LLAHALESITQDLDPERSDPALQSTVVVGHSQGGLLAKLTVVDSGLAFWNGLFDRPSDSLAVSDETREILERSLIFERVPSVSRVVFISTPHGGSFLTLNPLSNLVKKLISVPATVGGRLIEVLANDPDAIAFQSLEDMPTSIDNMRPGNRFLETLRTLPIVDGVGVHSIVAVQGSGPHEHLSDGVVQYLSAHLARGTELVVNSGHSAQVQPEAIAEVRRILREHLSELDQAGD